MYKYIIALVSIAGFFGLASTASAQDSDTSRWSITPYIWAPNTSVDLTFGDNNIGSGDISFGDLLVTLDAALAYWPGGSGSQFSVFGGIRYSGFDDRYDFHLAGFNFRFWPQQQIEQH